MKRRRDRPSLYGLLVLVCLYGSVKSRENEPVRDIGGSVLVPMPEPGLVGVKHNDYMCTGVSIPDQDLFITQFEPKADPRVAHHMLLFGCSSKAPHGSWSCKSSGIICDDEPHILFAWALNASGLHLPRDVGVQVGPSVGINSIIVQIHYGYPENYPSIVATNREAMLLHTTMERQRYIAGIYLIGSGSSIRPGTRHSFVDSACRFRGPKKIYPFAFRTHAHHLGEQIAGYVIKSGQWQLIGTRSPQDAQAFYPAMNNVEVNAGDTLAMRCVFNMEGKSHSVYMGADSEDEMCNFYIMYYTENDGRVLYSNECWEDAPRSLVYPPLPSLTAPTATPTTPPALSTESADGDNEHEEEDSYECPKPIPPGTSNSRCVNITNSAATTTTTTTTSHIPNPATTFPIPELDRQTPRSTPTDPSPSTPFYEGGSDTEFESLGLVPAEDWPLNGVDIPGMTLGQVSAVAVDKEGHVHVLHRGPVVWDYSSFNLDFTYRHKDNGPIKVPTLLKFSSVGAPERAWGESQFYMPHGLTIDPQGSFWVTDVALHQVFKYTKLGSSEPVMILGTAFKPGSGFGHFCQPANVAVDNSGNFYVADGYCNHRILKFSVTGKLLDTWQDPIDNTLLFIPHKLTLNSAQDKLYVADRENNRVVVYSTEKGRGEVLSSEAMLVGSPFAICMNGSSDWPMYGVFGGEKGVLGFSMDRSGKVINTWGPEAGFDQPHDMTVDPLNKAVYVTEIGPNRIWKFVPVNLKPVDITDLLDSHLSHQPELPIITTNHHNSNQDHSDRDKIDNDDNIHKKPNPQPSSATHHPPSSGSPQAFTTLSESTFAHGLLPDHPLQGLKPTDQDHGDDNDTISEGSSASTTEVAGKNGSASIEGSVKNEANPRSNDSNKVSTVNLGVFIAIIVMVIIFVLILIGVLKEHKYLRFKGAVCLRRGKVPIHSNGKVNGATKLRSNPKKTLHSLLGPSQLGFSRLRTYDSDSEEEEFPVFNRV